MAPKSINKQSAKKVLVIFYSFSGQTGGLLHSLVSGLKGNGIDVTTEKIRTVNPLRFPVGSIFGTFKMMLTTFFRQRVPVKTPETLDASQFDLVILAGPTWSYNPSGPVLALLDNYGKKLLANKTVLPLISCRGYWRMHWFGLKKILEKCGANIPNQIVFSHPAAEPWRTIGVFLKIAGKAPERSSVVGRYYSRFGHSKEQLSEAENFGRKIAQALKEEKPLQSLNFHTETALP